jgi:hypothetical protein
MKKDKNTKHKRRISMRRFLNGGVWALLVLFILSGCTLLSYVKEPSKKEVEIQDDSSLIEEEDDLSTVDEELVISPIEEDEDDSFDMEDADVIEDDAGKEPDAQEKEQEKKLEEEAKKKPLPYQIQIDVTNQVVTVLGRDKNGKYTKVVRQMIASTGASQTPTPLGKFIMPGHKGRWGYFTKFDVYAQYWSRIRGGILFHSVLFKKPDESTLSVSSYNNLGRPVSHGCIRLLVEDAKWLYYNAVRPGTEVIVIKGKKNPSLVAKLKPKPILPPVVSLTIEPSTGLEVIVGGEKKFTVKAKRKDGSVKDVTSSANWSVSDKKLASMSDGLFKALNPGSVKVTATYEGISSEVSVNIKEKEPQPVELIVSTPGEYVEVGKQLTLTAKVVFDDKTEKDVTGVAKWVSDNSDIASVDKGVVSGKNPGTTKIKAEYGGVQSALSITVKETAPKLEEIKLKAPNGNTIKIGETVQLMVNAVYSDGTVEQIKQGITWISADDAIAKVDDTGQVMGVGVGTVDITAKYQKGKYSDTITISVEQDENTPGPGTPETEGGPSDSESTETPENS